MGALELVWVWVWKEEVGTGEWVGVEARSCLLAMICMDGTKRNNGFYTLLRLLCTLWCLVRALFDLHALFCLPYVCLSTYFYVYDCVQVRMRMWVRIG